MKRNARRRGRFWDVRGGSGQSMVSGNRVPRFNCCMLREMPESGCSRLIHFSPFGRGLLVVEGTAAGGPAATFVGGSRICYHGCTHESRLPKLVLLSPVEHLRRVYVLVFRSPAQLIQTTTPLLNSRVCPFA